MTTTVRPPVPPAPARVTAYRPSPRPTFDGPALITRTGVTRHIWGDAEAGLVADWIYASTDRIHLLMFGLAPQGSFRHSREFRTVFAADEVLYVLSGTLVAANPETGEVVRAAAGECVFFRRDTWHHAFAQGDEPLRVLEFFAPPPSQGTSGSYARTRPYLEESRYTRDDVLGHLDRSPGHGGATAGGFRVVRDADLVWRREAGLMVGLVASTEHLTVGVVEIDPGIATGPRRHGGDAVLFGLDEPLMVRTDSAVGPGPDLDGAGSSVTVEMGPHDAVYIPQGAGYEILNVGRPARALLGVAPAYLP